MDETEALARLAELFAHEDAAGLIPRILSFRTGADLSGRGSRLTLEIAFVPRPRKARRLHAVPTVTIVEETPQQAAG